MAELDLNKAIEVLNSSANGVTTFNEDYYAACRLAVRLLLMIKRGEIELRIDAVGGKE